MESIFRKYENKFCPKVIKDFYSWQTHPELSQLYKKVLSISNINKLYDHWAEVIIARYLINNNIEPVIEVKNPSGKCADFKALDVYLHIKRLNIEEESSRQFNMAKRLDALKTICKPYSVDIEYYQDITPDEFRLFFKEAKKFILNGIPGKCINIVNSDGEELGFCSIVREHADSHVTIRGKPMFFSTPNTSKRFYRILDEAYNQFMPNATNVILITSEYSSDFDDLKNTLKFHNGFWQNKRRITSNFIVWFTFSISSDVPIFKLFARNNIAVPETVYRLFGKHV